MSVAALLTLLPALPPAACPHSLVYLVYQCISFAPKGFQRHLSCILQHALQHTRIEAYKY